jgi:hypothetical protein
MRKPHIRLARSTVVKPVRSKTTPIGLPDVGNKIMDRSYQRAGVVANGTVLSSGSRQATIS